MLPTSSFNWSSAISTAVVHTRNCMHTILCWLPTALSPRILVHIRCAGRPLDDYNRLLHVVIVGGGPTGVEVAGELSNLINRDLKKKYPDRAKAMRWVTGLSSAWWRSVFEPGSCCAGGG